MKHFVTTVLFLALILGASHARCQEIETTFDSIGKISSITAEMGSKAHLFPNNSIASLQYWW